MTWRSAEAIGVVFEATEACEASEHEWARAIIRLVKDPALRRRLADRG